MKNFFKKLSFVLAIAMVLTSVAPAVASAAATIPAKKINVKVDGEKTSTVTLKAGETEEVKLGLPSKKAFAEAGQTQSDYKTAAVSSNEDVVEVSKLGRKAYELNAVGAGTATVTFYAAKTKALAEAGKGKTATLKVTVEKKEFVATQTAIKAFQIVFPSASEAQTAVATTNDFLSRGDAPVTQDSKVIQLFEVRENGEKVQAYLVDATVDPLDATKVAVRTSAELKEKVTYEVLFAGVTKTFVAAEWIPTSIEAGYEYFQNPIGIDGGYAKLGYLVYATGDQGQKVNITDKMETRGVGVIEYKDLNETNYLKYSFAGDVIDFVVNDCTVQVQAIYTWFDANNESKTLTDDFEVKAADTRKWEIVGHKIVMNPTTKDPKFEKTATICYNDVNAMLLVKLGYDANGDGAINEKDGAEAFVWETADLEGNNDNADIVFVTANPDKLAVDKEYGRVYSLKDAKDTVNVHIYYQEKFVGSIAVKIDVERYMKDLVITPYGDKKYSYSDSSDAGQTTPDAFGYYWDVTDDSEIFNIKVVDQTGATYPGATIYVFKTTAALEATGDAINCSDPLVDTLEKVTSYEDLGQAAQLTGTDVTLTFAPETALEKIQTLQYRVVAIEDATEKEIAKVFNFTIKNTTNDAVTRLSIEALLNGGYSVYGMTSAGYRARLYQLVDTETDDYVLVDAVSTITGKAAEVAVAPDQKSFALVTEEVDVNKKFAKEPAVIEYIGGASEVAFVQGVVAHTTPSKIFLADGNYVLKAHTDGKVKAIKNHYHQNNPDKFAWEWVSGDSTNVDPDLVANDAFGFTNYVFVWYSPTFLPVFQWKVDNDFSGTADEYEGISIPAASWQDMSDNGYVMSFYRNESGQLAFKNLYKVDLANDEIFVVPVKRNVNIDVEVEY